MFCNHPDSVRGHVIKKYIPLYFSFRMCVCVCLCEPHLVTEYECLALAD